MKSVLLNASLITLLLLLIAGCDNQPEKKKNIDPDAYEKPLMEANKAVVRTEKQHIDDFLRRYKWDMTETGSGLQYIIYEEGNGPAVRKGQLAVLEYTVKLITGDIIYTSDDLGPMEFTVGKAEVISGLEEGILLLHVGDKAKFIIPSHLAYGLLGDEDRIPGKATLIYDIELLKLIN
jgi:gliding motility-associated peptidyl-prolyl isomerase